ncbi:lysylphosphatidylglycerol synthase transmembrane domain-containing protein [Goekera deserti]|uniref:UPF0104 family protein n=1 Tax=Goekera deserti TaxID=2497753 RepID=A0A7K3WCY1_9ACTN|nr:YbhN family protein [Goekera deserti]NDI46675.1 flippase-like domain-containing protein [Goekera deserti]NEL54244.1 UPF0104 family protein [Goekera deserti]
MTDRPRRWLRVLTPVASLAVVAVLVVAGRDRFVDAIGNLTGVRWRWVLAAAVAEAVSMGALARQQARLLRAGGGHAPLNQVVATTYAGNTISVGLPVAGPAAGTLYTFRRLRELGNEPALVSWVLTVSGVFSTVSFAVVIAVGCVLVGSPAGVVGALLAGVVAVVPSVVLLLALRSPAAQERVVGWVVPVVGWVAARVRRLDGPRAQSAVSGLVRQLGSQRLGRRDAAVVAGWSLVNWLADAACLALALVAVDVPVPWTGILIAWAAGAGAATLGLTPGGIGVVETALTAALVGVTVPLPDAVSAVLVYRFISLWLVFAVGAVLLALPRRGPHSRPRPRSPAAAPGEPDGRTPPPP